MFGFENLTGIDLDRDLISNANENLKSYLFKRASSSIQFITINALEHNYVNQPTVYFLFNPFNEAVLNKTINKILSSTSSETWFVYMNPMYKNSFGNEKIEVVCELRTKKYLEAIIYKLKH